MAFTVVLHSLFTFRFSLEFTLRPQTGKYLGERIHALAYDEKMLCRERVVQLDSAGVVLERANVVIAHDHVLEPSFFGKATDTEDLVGNGRKGGGKVGVHRLFPREHPGERTLIGEDRYHEDGRILVDRVDPKKEFARQRTEQIRGRASAECSQELFKRERSLGRSPFGGGFRFRRHETRYRAEGCSAIGTCLCDQPLYFKRRSIFQRECIIFLGEQ